MSTSAGLPRFVWVFFPSGNNAEDKRKHVDKHLADGNNNCKFVLQTSNVASPPPLLTFELE